MERPLRVQSPVGVGNKQKPTSCDYGLVGLLGWARASTCNRHVGVMGGSSPWWPCSFQMSPQKAPKAPSKPRGKGVILSSATRGSHRQSPLETEKSGKLSPRAEAWVSKLLLFVQWEGWPCCFTGLHRDVGGQPRARPPKKRTLYHHPVAPETLTQGRRSPLFRQPQWQLSPVHSVHLRDHHRDSC